MRSIVTFLLLALLGAIAAFLISNTTPIALTFLGVQTLALPLAVWIAGALLAGIATGLWFLILFRLAERQGAKQAREQRRAEFGPEDFAVVNDGLDSREYTDTPDDMGDYPTDRGGGYREGGGYEQESRNRYEDERDNAAYGPENGRRADYRDAEIRDSLYPETYPDARRDQDWGGDAEPFESGDRPSSEPEFEVVEARSPVYDANYRVIRPPAENTWQREDPYSDEPEPSASATSYGADTDRSTDVPPRQTAQPEPARPSSLKKSQPQDDWDIEEDLDW